jgi:tetratricopeptide (TPR) repeat protein
MSKKHRANPDRHDLHRSGWKLVIPVWLSCLIICSLGLLVYSNTFQSSFHFDDETSIVNNPAIRHLSDFRGIFGYSATRFVTYLSFALNYKIGGLEVAGYHVFNLLVHILSGLMVWLLVHQILRTPVMKDSSEATARSLLPLIAALLFIVHPLQTQSVTYIAQRAASTAALFYLLSVWFYGYARLGQISGAQLFVTSGRYAAAFLCGLVAVFSKETALTLPFAIVLYELSFFKAVRKIRWGFVGLVAAVFVTIPIILISRGMLELKVVGALPLSDYLFTQPGVWLTYFRLLVFPVGQNLDYDFPMAHSLFEPLTLIAITVIGLLIFLGYRLFGKHRVLSFGIFWFFLTLLPESSILPLPDVIFEHRLYLPMVGFCLFAVFVLCEFMKSTRLPAIVSVAGGLLCLLGYAAHTRNEVWRDDVSLWTDVTSKSPKKARGYLNLGRAYSDRGFFNLANDNFIRAQMIDPSNADVFGNRANILVQQGQLDGAISESNRALALGGGLNYQLARIYYSRGTAYLLKNQLDSALADFNRALLHDENHETAYFNRGIVFSRKGETKKALEDYTRCVALNPRNAKALNNRGIIYRDAGQLNEALGDFDKAIAAQHDFPAAYLNRGMVRGLKGQLDPAIEDFTSFINLSPKNFDGYYNRGVARLRKQQFEGAIADFSQAFVFNPSYGSAFIDRARAYIAIRQFAAAENDLKRAQSLGLRVDPALIVAAKKGKK